MPKVKISPEQPPQTDETKCCFWMPRKRRYCSIVSTVKSNELDKHKSRCMYRPMEQPAYYSLNVNQIGKYSEEIPESKDAQEPAETSKTRKTKEYLMHLDKDTVDSIIGRINDVYDKVKESISIEIKTHDALTPRLIESHNGKHAIQQASLLGHMRDQQMLGTSVSFAEFGAGSGEMTRFVQLAVKNPAFTLLVDRQKIKLNLDQDFKKTNWKRIIIDIKDLDLAKVETVTDHPLVVYSKHLCGVATDLTLKCIQNYKTNGGSVGGILIALCCHQLCTFGQYINPEYLKELKISEREFEIICYLTTWAVCGKPVKEDW
ncbi:tRNA:m(4)X modification enzyme TRM13 [Terramyces sp. JEL0728]|nr:tRNA:m(4)X modification enzyme TRM13 [Terramyces sp. JEL0728]